MLPFCYDAAGRSEQRPISRLAGSKRIPRTLTDELLRIWRETGTTILFVTHSIHEAAYLGQQVLVLAANPGRVREIVPIDLPQPRRLAIRDTAEFGALAGRLRAVLATC